MVKLHVLEITFDEGMDAIDAEDVLLAIHDFLAKWIEVPFTIESRTEEIEVEDEA